MTAYFYDLRDAQKVNFVHIAVNEEWDIGLYDESGAAPTVTIDLPGVATLVRLIPSPINNNFRVTIRGVGTGNSLVHAREGQTEVALTQAVVRETIAATAIETGPKTGKLTSFLDDSKIDNKTNAELTLTLKVFLQQLPASATVTNSDGTTYKPIAWTNKSWTAFQRAFKSQGQAAWDGKFWLKTPGQYFPLVKNSYRHFVYCRLKLQIEPTAASAHRVLSVMRVTNDNHRSNSGLTVGELDSFDIRKSRYVQGGRIYFQVTIQHELGHMLGLDHIGTVTGVAGCTTTDQGANNCYCTASNDCSDLLGMGHALSLADALPWKERVALHTKTREDESGVSMIRLPPEKL